MHYISRTNKCTGHLLYFHRKTLTTCRENLCVLGVETSCDDTGLALVCKSKTERHVVGGNVLSHVINSQQNFHSRYGGIIPPRAQDLHRAVITDVFERCIREANIEPHQIDAIAVTVKPGLPLSLLVGLRFAKHLSRKFQIPVVPIHHMEAHALQARMESDIQYPFLCLLISGGHCQLVFVHDAENFSLLGETLDDAPGEAFDKIARRLRLFLLQKYRGWNGGQAIEDAAKMATNDNAFEFPLPLARYRNCNFSFAGIKNNSFRAIRNAEFKEKTPPDRVISNYADFCAGLLRASTRHLMHRTQRAFEFCIQNDFFGKSSRSLVISGGVANNDYIFENLAYLAEQYECRTIRPSKKYCSDNGVMIAWNGIERILANENCLRWDLEELDIMGKAHLGKSLIEKVEIANLKCKWIKKKSQKL